MRLFLNRLMIIGGIGLLIVGCPEAWGADWMFYGGTDQYSCFYDIKSISHPSENIVEVSEKQNYTSKSVNFMVGELGKKYENLSHSIAVWQIDYRDKKFRFLSLTHYSKGGESDLFMEGFILLSPFGGMKSFYRWFAGREIMPGRMQMSARGGD